MNALDELEKEHQALQTDETQKILKSEENFFKIITVKNPEDDLSAFNYIFEDFGVLNSEGKLRCAIKFITMKSNQAPNVHFYCILSGTWIDTEVEDGDDIQIFGKFWPEHRAILIKNSFDNSPSIFSNHFIIVEPTIMLNPTMISSSYPCFRRAIVGDLFSGKEDISLAMTKGYIIIF